MASFVSFHLFETGSLVSTAAIHTPGSADLVSFQAILWSLPSISCSSAGITNVVYRMALSTV